MTYLQLVYLYLILAPMFAVIDILWIGGVAKNFYMQHIGNLLGDVRATPAVVFYALYTIGIIVFAISPGIEYGSVVRAVVLGALLGLVAYGTYDLTNLATLKSWPVIVVIVDMVWGMVVTAAMAALGYGIARLLF